MPHFEVNAMDEKTNVLVTSVIQTDASASQVAEEVKKGGLILLNLRVLSPQEMEMYERMRVMARQRNRAGLIVGGVPSRYQTKPKIRWGRVASAIGLLVAILLSLLAFL